MLRGERTLPKIIFIIVGSILIIYCLKFISIQHAINNNIYKINDHETRINKRISDIIITVNITIICDTKTTTNTSKERKVNYESKRN